MAETQPQAVSAGSNHGIGLIQEILQQRINADITLLGARHQAFPQAPAGVVGPEAVNHALFPKDVVKPEIQLRQAVHIGRHVVQVVGKRVTVNEGLGPVRIREESLQLGLPAQHLPLELFEEAVKLVIAGSIGDGDGFVGLDVIQILFPGLHFNVIALIQGLQFPAEELHAVNNALGSGGIGLHFQRSGHQRRIIVIHATGNGLVLQGAQAGKLAGTVLGIGSGQDDTVAYIFAVLGQNPQRQGRIQLVAQTAIMLVTGHVAGAVTAVMANVEGLVALGRRGQMAGRVGVIGIIARRQLHVGKQFLTGSLGAGSPTGQKQEYEGDFDKFHSLSLFDDRTKVIKKTDSYSYITIYLSSRCPEKDVGKSPKLREKSSFPSLTTPVRLVTL